MMNIINGGAHADTGVDIQEFMILPDRRRDLLRGACAGASRPTTRSRACCKAKGLSTGLGDEGGFAPDLASNRAALDLIVEAIEKAGFTPGTDIALGLDVAATEFFKDGVYHFEGRHRHCRREAHRVLRRARRRATRSSPSRTRCTRTTGRAGRTSPPSSAPRCSSSATTCSSPTPKRLADGIARHAGNSILVKVNQIGTLTETLDAVALAQRAGYTAVISHRSGETEDTTIADLAVATNCRPDQDRRARPQRAGREVQPAVAHRRGARRRRGLRRPQRLPAVHASEHPPGFGTTVDGRAT